MRRKILRLYFCRQPHYPLIPHHSLNGVSPVETQNLASHKQPIAISACYNATGNKCIFSLVRRKILRLYFCRQPHYPLIPHHSLNGVSPVETQNLASHKQPIAISACYNATGNKCIFSLVRRKILRLYFYKQRISASITSSPAPRSHASAIKIPPYRCVARFTPLHNYTSADSKKS